MKALCYFETSVRVHHSTLCNIVPFLDLLGPKYEGIMLLRNVGKSSPVATEQPPIRRKLAGVYYRPCDFAGTKGRAYSSCYVGYTVTIDKESEHFSFSLRSNRDRGIRSKSDRLEYCDHVDFQEASNQEGL